MDDGVTSKRALTGNLEGRRIQRRRKDVVAEDAKKILGVGEWKTFAFNRERGENRAAAA